MNNCELELVVTRLEILREMKQFTFEGELMEGGMRPYVEPSGVAATTSGAAGTVKKMHGGDMRMTKDIHRRCNQRSACVEEDDRGISHLSLLYFIYLSAFYLSFVQI